MDYRIEKQPGFEVLLKVEADRLTYWSETDLNENQLRMISTKQKCGGLYRDMSSDSEHLNGFELNYFPAVTWAVFVAKGSSRADAKQKTFDQITKEWFPQTNYRLDNTYSVMISYQTPVDQDNDNDLGVFWVPIVEAQTFYCAEAKGLILLDQHKKKSRSNDLLFFLCLCPQDTTSL